MTKPPKYKRKPAEEERDKRNIASAYLSGKLQAEIAADLHLSQSTISRTLKELQDEWKAERVLDIDAQKQKELAKIDNLEITYWDAWRRSIRTKSIQVKTAHVVGSTIIGQDISDKTEEEVGDRTFLDGVQWCIEARLRIFGIEAPKKTDVTIVPFESSAVRNTIQAVYGNT